MKAGELRHRIKIQKLDEAQGGTGEILKGDADWTDFADRWAAVEPLQGRELFIAQQISAEVNIRVRLRYLKDVTARMRVLFGTREFDIKAVLNPLERNRETELLCKELV